MQSTTYIDVDTQALEICCPTHGHLVSLQWLADRVEIVNGSKYLIGSDYLRISGGFEDGCVTYTCKASFLASGTVSQETEVCAGSKLISLIAEIRFSRGQSS